jgi:hypothetical protein
LTPSAPVSTPPTPTIPTTPPVLPPVAAEGNVPSTDGHDPARMNPDARSESCNGDGICSRSLEMEAQPLSARPVPPRGGLPPGPQPSSDHGGSPSGHMHDEGFGGA